jgi:hypothetical protein
MAGRPLHCIEFSMVGAGPQSNPFSVPLRSGDVEFEVFDHAGSPLPDANIHGNFGGVTGLDTGHRLEARIRVRRVTTVALKLLSMAGPATVEALARGMVVDSGAMDPVQGVAQLITLNARAIDAVTIAAPGDETALIELCISGR